jgi:DNA-binding beta-propeller fold protein YncE
MVYALLAGMILRDIPPPPYFETPAGGAPAIVRAGGTSILPNGRLLTPRGSRFYGGDDCWNIVVSPDGRSAALFYTDGLNLYGNIRNPKATQTKLARPGFAFAGQFAPDGSRLVVSSGEQGGIQIIPVADPEHPVDISANVNGAKDTFVNDLALSADGRYCYAVDVARQDLLTFDLTQGRLVSRVKAGREPYAIAIDPQGSRVLVANIGIFNYSPVPRTDNPRFHADGLSRPAFAFPSRESEHGVYFQGRFVPGVGDPNVPDAHSVFAYDLTSPDQPRKVAQANTGLLIHAVTDRGHTVGGSGPCALACANDRLYVCNSNNDSVQIFRSRDLRSLGTIRLNPSPLLKGLRGVIPDGVAVDPDGATLYVSEAGLNAIAVIDLRTKLIRYQIPTGYYPTSVRVVAPGRLAVSSLFGLGQGPQGAKNPRDPDDERYGLSAIPGMGSLIDLPTTAEEKANLTATVLENNGIKEVPAPSAPSPIPTQPGRKSEQIKYVVYITKENHTFDAIFGTLENAEGDPSYAEWGERGWIREHHDPAERVAIMPNHLKLARQFAISDSFYLEPGASGTGHRWLCGNYASLWTSKMYYSGWRWSMDPDVPGRMPSFHANGSMIPEDYLENGSMFEHLYTSGVTFRNYGEAFEFPGEHQGTDVTKTGTVERLNVPISNVFWKNTCWDFPEFNTYIPDVARFEWFKEDLEKNYLRKGKHLPHFINLVLPNDHGTDPRPDDGYPYVCSFMADNDLALGKTIEYLSSLPEWKNMVVFVAQDDCGGDDDHVYRERSYVLALGPWVKRGYVSHLHTSFMSVEKTIYEIFGCGPNNMFDAIVTDLRDMFTTTPDYSPYVHALSDTRVFEEAKAYRVNDPKYRARRFMKPSMEMDDPEFIEEMRRGNKPH